MSSADKNMTTVEHLVVDSAGFLNNVALQRIGRRIYTVVEVVAEIRDASTRRRLQVLPYQLEYVTPSEDAVRAVTAFAKKTGDYGSLSAVDIKVLAAVYTLEVEKRGTDEHLRREPFSANKCVTTVWGGGRRNTNNVAGFHMAKKAEMELDEEEDVSEFTGELIGLELEEKSSKQELSEEKTSSTTEEEGSSSDDADHWITADNLSAAVRRMGGEKTADAGGDEFVSVACLTTDFAVQNVLVHMGLSVVASDGRLIRRLRRFLLRCRACFAVCPLVTRKFCPKCGNAPLDKVSVALQRDGTLSVYLSRRKVPSSRGLRYSLQAPQGGKHAANCRVVEDQPAPQNRLSKKALVKQNPLDVDYEALNAPFVANDVNSRSAVLGLKSSARQQRNPNVFKKGTKRGGKKR